MWEWEHKGGGVPKNRRFWTVVLEKTLESPLNSKEIKPVKPKGNQPWTVIGRTDAEAEAPLLWPPGTHIPSFLSLSPNRRQSATSLEKTLMLGKIEGMTRRGRQQLDGIINSMDMNLSKLWDIVVKRGAWHVQSIRSQKAGDELVTEQ